MDWQLLVVALLLVLAAGFVAQRTWRTWFAKPGAGCGGGCGCSKPRTNPELPEEQLISEDQLLSRLRKR